MKSAWGCEYYSPMQLDDLNVLAAFLAVAEERSFTRAAERLGNSRTQLSERKSTGLPELANRCRAGDL